MSTPVLFDETAFRATVKRDLKENADYGADDTFTVGDRVWAALFGDVLLTEEVADTVYRIVDEEWDWWFEEGPIDWNEEERQ